MCICLHLCTCTGCDPHLSQHRYTSVTSVCLLGPSSIYDTFRTFWKTACALHASILTICIIESLACFNICQLLMGHVTDRICERQKVHADYCPLPLPTQSQWWGRFHWRISHSLTLCLIHLLCCSLLSLCTICLHPCSLMSFCALHLQYYLLLKCSAVADTWGSCSEREGWHWPRAARQGQEAHWRYDHGHGQQVSSL